MGIPSSIYYKHRHSQLLRDLDNLLSTFEFGDCSSIGDSPAADLPRGSDADSVCTLVGLGSSYLASREVQGVLMPTEFIGSHLDSA